MSFIRDTFGPGSRPYPIDRERRRRVMIALAEKELTISSLARKLKLSKPLVSLIVTGRRLSLKTERRIADFLGKPADYLFPPRTPEEIQKMRKAEQSAPRKGKAAWQIGLRRQ